MVNLILKLLADILKVSNWYVLPEKIKEDTVLRDKMLKELENKFPVDETTVDSKFLYTANKYLLNRIKQEIGGK